MNIVVVNLKHWFHVKRDQYDYIGRANEHYGLAGSPLANPFKIGRDGDRDEVIAKYRTWLWTEFQKRTDVYDELVRLKELGARNGHLILVCWCKPKACHGDVIKSCLEWMAKHEI